MGHLRVTKGYFFSELHPKVRQTCFLLFLVYLSSMTGVKFINKVYQFLTSEKIMYVKFLNIFVFEKHPWFPIAAFRIPSF